MLDFLYNNYNMPGKKKQPNTLYITHSGELLIWLLIILFFVVIFFSVFYFHKKSTNVYNIFMQDVDGLIVGSPVRMMGIEVGHVIKLEPTNEEVYVKFIITDKTVNIPRGTMVTVEFSGMAGSKSLELYLPDKNTYIDKNTPILTVNPPKRLHDAAGLLNEMFEKIGAIIYTSSSFSEKIQCINIQTGTEANLLKFMDYADKMVSDYGRKAEKLDKQLQDMKNKK